MIDQSALVNMNWNISPKQNLAVNVGGPTEVSK